MQNKSESLTDDLGSRSDILQSDFHGFHTNHRNQALLRNKELLEEST